MARKRSILYLTNKGLQLDLSAHALSKLFARYEIFKMVLNLPGDIVDCGVYREPHRDFRTTFEKGCHRL